MAKGGKRQGSGRPKGAVTRPQLRDYFDDKEILSLVKHLKEQSKTDPQIAKFVAEQIFGKAAQPIGGDPENPVVFQVVGMKIVNDAGKNN